MLKGLFIPGYACTSEIWRPIREELASGCKITWVDWPPQKAQSFHDVDDFAFWLCRSVDIEQYDFIVGHSMGGLAALRLVEIARDVNPTTILIETFLSPPAPFFQNLVLNEDASPQVQAISEMLSREKVYYSQALGENLGKIDLRRSVARWKRKLYAFYGDRGCGEPERVRHELQWPEDVSAWIDLIVIPDACHFPMVENPGATLNAMKNILRL